MITKKYQYFIYNNCNGYFVLPISVGNKVMKMYFKEFFGKNKNYINNFLKDLIVTSINKEYELEFKFRINYNNDSYWK